MARGPAPFRERVRGVSIGSNVEAAFFWLGTAAAGGLTLHSGLPGLAIDIGIPMALSGHEAREWMRTTRPPRSLDAVGPPPSPGADDRALRSVLSSEGER